jgi:hypothetical protein
MLRSIRKGWRRTVGHETENYYGQHTLRYAQGERICESHCCGKVWFVSFAVEPENYYVSEL